MAKFNFTEYMHQLAIKLKDVAHIDDDPAHKRFFRASSLQNIEEIIQSLPEFNGFAIVVEDNEEGNYNMNGSNYILDRQLCSFFIVKKAVLLDAKDRGDQIRAAEVIMRKIISKLRRDYNTDNAGETQIGLRNIEWNSLSYFSFGPVLDNCYGVYCSFTNPTHMDYRYDAADWTE